MTIQIDQPCDNARPDSDAQSAFALMLRLRRFEEKAGMLYALGTLGTPCPLGVGQEAALTALAAVMQPADVFVALRGTPALRLAFGEACAGVFRELLPAADESEEAAQPVNVLMRAPMGSVATLPAMDDVRAALRQPAVSNDPAITVLVLDPQGGATEAVAQLSGDLVASGRPVLALLIVPRDARPPAPELPPNWSLRAIDGADYANVRDALYAARQDLLSGPGEAGTRQILMTILTPPFAGHARSAGARPPSREDTPDPLKIVRQRLLAGGPGSEAICTAMEAAIRDEVTAAARSLTED